DEALLKYIKNSYGCLFHPLGTAAIFSRKDGSVVNPELRVYGMANMLVVRCWLI
ncbi:hypothetical protein BD311DRAFT_629954, partial [Dichomitus squalens]